MKFVKTYRAEIKRGRPRLHVNAFYGHVTLIVGGPIYVFSLRVGRLFDLAIGERKEVRP